MADGKPDNVKSIVVSTPGEFPPGGGADWLAEEVSKLIYGKVSKIPPMEEGESE